jgi:hypothetical protein
MQLLSAQIFVRHSLSFLHDLPHSTQLLQHAGGSSGGVFSGGFVGLIGIFGGSVGVNVPPEPPPLLVLPLPLLAPDELDVPVVVESSTTRPPQPPQPIRRRANKKDRIASV